MPALSVREREILAGIAAGETSKEIADQLNLSTSTVKFHLGNAMRKLGARARAEAIGLAMSTGQITRPAQRRT